MRWLYTSDSRLYMLPDWKGQWWMGGANAVKNGHMVSREACSREFGDKVPK